MTGFPSSRPFKAMTLVEPMASSCGGFSSLSPFFNHSMTKYAISIQKFQVLDRTRRETLTFIQRVTTGTTSSQRRSLLHSGLFILWKTPDGMEIYEIHVHDILKRTIKSASKVKLEL